VLNIALLVDSHKADKVLTVAGFLEVDVGVRHFGVDITKLCLVKIMKKKKKFGNKIASFYMVFFKDSHDSVPIRTKGLQADGTSKQK
jgi:hypothetical protein